MTHYRTTWRNKFLTTDAKTLRDMALILQGAAEHLSLMQSDGVELVGGAEDDYAQLVTANPLIAKKYDMEEENQEEEEMEKYAVEEDKDLEEKKAGEGPRCPVCDKELEQHGNVQLCPEHGSEPFEKEEETSPESPNEK